MYYLNCFFIYSIIGHIIESFVYQSGSSGILYGFWTPIYGIGCVLIIGCFNKFLKEKEINKYLKAFYIFLIGAVFLSFIEFIGGILIEKIFDVTFWDYSNLKFNIGKYTALEMSLVWGIGSLLLIYLIKPIVDKLIKRIPKIFTLVLLILFGIDIALTIANKGF